MRSKFNYIYCLYYRFDLKHHSLSTYALDGGGGGNTFHMRTYSMNAAFSEKHFLGSIIKT